MNPPQKAKLHPEEVFVGPIFDESGLKFFLVYNKEVQHLYHILNEDGYVPETFISLNEDIFLGKRTQFAFYNDREYHRKILIGAKGENVMKNNWYDGPFDQMPDNYILWGHIPYYMQYIEAAYPSAKGRIDEFGNYLDNPGTRVAVGPYYVYFSLDDLHFVRKCTQQNLSASKFYFCITQQVYNIPATINYFDRLAIP